MPELPDVETFRRFLNRTAIGQTIENIDVQDELIPRGVSARKLQAEVGKKLDSISAGMHVGRPTSPVAR